MMSNNSFIDEMLISVNSWCVLEVREYLRKRLGECSFNLREGLWWDCLVVVFMCVCRCKNGTLSAHHRKRQYHIN